MKKSTLVVLIGGFILLTALLGPVSSEKMYKKQKNFNSPEEIIQVLETKPILRMKDGTRGELKETEDFSECLSVRKRLTESDLHYAKIDVEEVVKLDEKSENDLLNYYSKLRERFSKRLPISKQEAVRLKVNTYYYSNPRTGEIEKNQYDNSSYEVLDLVLIDEGEGYVIDFVNMSNSEYPPDYSKINANEGIYYDGHENMSDDAKSGENISESQADSHEEVENNA
ncbi:MULTISPECIES: hypothetical protein [Clostridium]|uniref:Uncharacterized protein n=2 Tax=Clostridium butyricum TaxID=1492 RepID=A0AAP9UE23_CLOBU|nr:MULTISPECIES: hypothetical protein [Clostridium]ALP90313.1 hypothetical protein ATN24_09230 [Clostridium butyricum]ALS16767.1 hypothetical protein ATD26_07780 [Clostridium butyricum]ANF13930.1 hypothetical protein AZ909_07675 [Clostridium butyricum]AOR93998.1 hypothetical protein BBB49_07855 [Clostridium butyricum]AXB84699.1 hypothetical protein DRB99_06880 [Clostridium butyricum]